ncbi:MAG: acyl-CoA synthetase [Gammaproteobacteria bacterium]|nr:acyl-CoA synthetase [Gammaproteobacteria bacterium]
MYPGKWASSNPDKPAAINSVSGEAVTFRQLDDRSNQLVHLLRDRGLQPGQHMAIFMENQLTFFEVVWAALRSGLYLTPINSHLTGEEARYILQDCQAEALVTSQAMAPVAEQLSGANSLCHTMLMVDGAAPGFEDYETAIASFPASPLTDQPAGQFMMYSSGTTGRPKGIMRPLSGMRIDDPGSPIGGMQRNLWGFDDSSVYLSPAPLYHGAPLGFTTGTLALGGTVVMMPKFDELEALRAIDKYRVTHSQWVPTMFTRMLALPETVRSSFELSSHSVAIHAAAPCPQGVKQKMIDWWGPILYEYYSGSEQNGLTHCGPDEWLEHPGTVGKAVFGTIHICDEEGHELESGSPGLVYFELPESSFSYHGDAAKTRSTQHPQHANWTTLGDVGYVDDDGYLFLTDRATFMIISGGVNIYPQEVEDKLIMHPSVADVAVIGVPDERMGEAVKAIVQPEPHADPDQRLAEELMEYARANLAHYKCPKSVEFMVELPRLPTGKLYKRLLKDRYWGKGDSRIV